MKLYFSLVINFASVKLLGICNFSLPVGGPGIGVVIGSGVGTSVAVGLSPEISMIIPFYSNNLIYLPGVQLTLKGQSQHLHF